MQTGEELVLKILKKELLKISKKADKDEKEIQEYMGVGTETVKIHEDIKAILEGKSQSDLSMKKLASIKRRKAKVDKILEKDMSTLMSKEEDSARERDLLKEEIQRIEFRINMGKTTC